MKTKYCDKYCEEGLHTAICINRRRDAGEYDNPLEKRIEALEQEVKELRNQIRVVSNGDTMKQTC